MTWGSWWQVAPCEAMDPSGQHCGLAAGHEGDHRTAAAIARHERSAWIWRLLIAGGAALVLAYVAYGR